MRNQQGGKQRSLWIGGWLLAAVWAAGFPLVSALGTQRAWGVSAAVGYLCAALAACWLPRRGARGVAITFALVGAVVLPFLYLLVAGQAQSEVGVIERSGRMLLDHGSPYLAHPHAVDEYTPYLPGMAVFGVPRALLGGGGVAARVLGDARVWCAAVFLGCLWGGHRVLRIPVDDARVSAGARREVRLSGAAARARGVVPAGSGAGLGRRGSHRAGLRAEICRTAHPLDFTGGRT